MCISPDFGQFPMRATFYHIIGFESLFATTTQLDTTFANPEWFHPHAQ